MWNLDSAPAHRVMRRGQNHLYLAPHPLLRGSVAHYTITFPGGGAAVGNQKLTLMPDIGGCFVFTPEAAHGDLFWGANTKAVVVNTGYEDALMMFFIEFLPGGATRLFGAPMAALADDVQLVDNVLPGVRARVCEALYATPDLSKVLPAVDAILLCAPAREGLLAPGVSAALLRELKSLPAQAPVRALADRTGYSERHLARLFTAEYGLGVKACTRILRIHQILGLLDKPIAPLALLAQQAGYYDQAHLDHDFKAVCGVSPSEYLSSMAGFYKEEFKF